MDLELLGFKTVPDFCPYHGVAVIDKCRKCNRPLREAAPISKPRYCQHCRERLRYSREELQKLASSGAPTWIGDKAKLRKSQTRMSLNRALCVNQECPMRWKWRFPENLRSLDSKRKRVPAPTAPGAPAAPTSPESCDECGCPIIGRCPNCEQRWPEDFGIPFPMFCSNCGERLRYSHDEVLQQLGEPEVPRLYVSGESRSSTTNSLQQIRYHVELSDKIIKKIGLKGFLATHRGLSRTQVADYRARKIKGNISEKKRASIEAAIDQSAKELGLLSN